MVDVPSGRSRLLPVAVVVLVVLAGCGALSDGAPPAPDHVVSVTVSNDHDAAYHVGVFVVPQTADGVEVTYANGSTRVYEVESVDALPPTALRNATGVAAAGAAGHSESVTVGPNEGVGFTVRDAPSNAAVVYVVRRADGPDAGRGAGVVRCAEGADRTDLHLAIRADGSVHVAVTCRDAG